MFEFASVQIYLSWLRRATHIGLSGLLFVAIVLASLPLAFEAGNAKARSSQSELEQDSKASKQALKEKQRKAANKRAAAKKSRAGNKRKASIKQRKAANKRAAAKKRRASNKRKASSKQRKAANKRAAAKKSRASNKRKASSKQRKAANKRAAAKKSRASNKRKASSKQRKLASKRSARQSAKRSVKSRKAALVRKKRQRASSKKRARSGRARVVHARPTLGTVFGLHRANDPLSLRSSVAHVLEPATQRVLFSKNSGVVLPIASITKLMTAIVIIDAGQPAREMLTVTRADIDRIRRSSSRLSVGTRLSRAEMLQLSLMSSANRAANALGRHYPGGLSAFVSAMNAKARMFGMLDTQFADPSGLSGSNVSTATDLARLAVMANEYPLIREYSTARGLQVDTGYRRLKFHNTNRLIANQNWSIGLQKTGYIAEAGRCLVMHTRIDGRELVIVLLDSAGKSSRFADAGRIKKWLLKSGPKIAASGGVITVN